jgi:hypothetical protein
VNQCKSVWTKDIQESLLTKFVNHVVNWFEFLGFEFTKLQRKSLFKHKINHKSIKKMCVNQCESTWNEDI